MGWTCFIAGSKVARWSRQFMPASTVHNSSRAFETREQHHLHNISSQSKTAPTFIVHLSRVHQLQPRLTYPQLRRHPRKVVVFIISAGFRSTASLIAFDSRHPNIPFLIAQLLISEPPASDRFQTDPNSFYVADICSFSNLVGLLSRTNKTSSFNSGKTSIKVVARAGI